MKRTHGNVYALDEVDRSLIDVLRQNPRCSNRAMATIVGIGSVAFCFLRIDRACTAEVVERLRAIPQVWQMSQSFGRFDIELLAACADRDELVDVIMTQVRTIEAVEVTSTMEVVEVPHHSYHWARFLD